MRITQYLSSSVGTQQVLSPCLELTCLHFHDQRELAITHSLSLFFFWSSAHRSGLPEEPLAPLKVCAHHLNTHHPDQSSPSCYHQAIDFKSDTTHTFKHVNQ